MGTLLYLCLTFVVIYSHLTIGHMTEILVEDDGADVVKSNSVEPVPPESGIGNTCHVEFQVLKKVLGHCVKLGRNSRGCVAGAYLHPFHPECL